MCNKKFNKVLSSICLRGNLDKIYIKQNAVDFSGKNKINIKKPDIMAFFAIMSDLRL
jgi:hypothetical protein